MCEDNCDQCSLDDMGYAFRDCPRCHMSCCARCLPAGMEDEGCMICQAMAGQKRRKQQRRRNKKRKGD